MNPLELKKLMSGQWCNLQLLVLNYASEEERRARLDELDGVNYRGATLRGERRFFDLETKSLNDKGCGIPVVLSSWEMKQSPST